MTIEDIILDHDRRGISNLRPYIASDFCDQAALLILDKPGTVFITTGFYILAAGAPETDGPPGAISIGNALETLGYNVIYVTDRYTSSLITKILGSSQSVVDFPITDDYSSNLFAAKLLDKYQPSLLISIERCGLTDEGMYRNMKNLDISQYTARIDHVFTAHPASVGIGDGGNEIGLGNLKKHIPTVQSLVAKPCVTKVTKLIISSVSNWGGYGLIAAISLRTGRNLLPTIEQESDLVKKFSDHGAVDSMSLKAEYKVDGFSLEENSATLSRLHEFIQL